MINLNNEMGIKDQQFIDIGSIISLRSDQGILGTVLEKFNEDDGAKYKILINGRTLTLPESRIGLVKSEVDDKVLDELEAEHIGTTQKNELTDNDKEPYEETQSKLLVNRKETILKPPATKNHFSFSRNISNIIDESYEQSSVCDTCEDLDKAESNDEISSTLDITVETEVIKLDTQNPYPETENKNQNEIVQSYVKSTGEIGAFNYSRNIALSISIWIAFNVLLGIIIENL